jgi:hypothetical protein
MQAAQQALQTRGDGLCARSVSVAGARQLTLAYSSRDTSAMASMVSLTKIRDPSLQDLQVTTGSFDRGILTAAGHVPVLFHLIIEYYKHNESMNEWIKSG